MLSFVKSTGLIALAVVLSVGSTLGLISYHKTLANDFTLLRQATYSIQMTDRGTCSGVLIEDEVLLTAGHCVDPSIEHIVNGTKASIIADDDVHDVALLKVPGLMCPCVPVAETYPSIDSKVVVVGFPLDMAEFLTEGRVMGPIKMPEEADQFPEDMKERIRTFMAFTAPIAPGNSGGPLFQYMKDGWRVVGIASAVAVAPVGGFIPNLMTHMALAVSIQPIKDLIQKYVR